MATFERKGDKEQALTDVQNIYTSPDLPYITAAVRRIPCLCQDACKEQLGKPWDYGKTYKEQDHFKTAPNCRLNRAMGNLNDWTF
ncbi:MAG: hypothetical protein ACRCSI_09370, partial [Eubacterium aggregans]